MNIPTKPNSRLDKILKKLVKQEELINNSDKGSIEINFSGDSETVSVKVVIQ